MFGNRNRRRRATSNPPSNSNVSASAATAAAQAFLSSRASNTSLSSAAAAAALRSRPTTPTSVADVQTKRTIRRNGSTSSAGSCGPPGTALVRRGSSGSMTERTFRDPSPNRASPVPSAYDAPPVPAIPTNINTAGGKHTRRSASMDTPGLRVASPPPIRPGGRGSSLGPSATASQETGLRNQGLSSVSEVNGESRGSVNFSYPTSTRPISPEGQRRLTFHQNSSASPRIVSPNNQNLVYDPNSRRFLPLADILAIEQRLNEVANGPVKKKKQTPTAQGTHLAAGSVGGRIRGTAVDALERQSNTSIEQSITQPVSKSTIIPEFTATPAGNALRISESNPEIESHIQQAPPAAIAQPRKKKKRVIINDSDSDQASILPNSSADESDVPSQGFKSRAGALLAKKPSVVREDREREEEEDDSPSPPEHGGLSVNRDEFSRTVSPTPLPRSSAGMGHVRAQPIAQFAQEQKHTRSVSQPSPEASTLTPTKNDESPARNGRVQSVSPARTPHFMTTPETLMVRHQPPPRSVSPRKSALKHSSMSSEARGPSPSDGGSLRRSDMSNDEEQPKKKGHRVSFDEGNNTVLGQSVLVASNSPMVPSPQTKRSWFSIGRGKKKDVSTTGENDDEVMQPRPALPSFGSVRERKTHKETEERPLVRPPEAVENIASVTSPASPLFTSHQEDALEFPMGQSNDHIADALLTPDAVSKNAANISKSREPLPPDVTSVEGTGEFSDASSTYSLENNTNTIGLARSNSVKVGPEDGHVDTYRELASPTRDHFEDYQANEDIPEISVQVPTPNPETTKPREWLDMPGGYRGFESDVSSSDQEAKDEVFHATTVDGVIGLNGNVAQSQTDDSIVDGSNFSGISSGTQQGSESHPEPILEETEEESEGDSIYSDAAEDFEEPDDGGFMSLDAVVESPVLEPVVFASSLPTQDSPSSKSMKDRIYMSNQLQRKSSEPEPEEGWEKAQQYWKNLSVDKRRQLELQAQQDADAEESEEETKPAPKPKKMKKKTVTVESPISPIMVTNQASSFPNIQKSNQERIYMVPPGSKAGPNGHAITTMRSSMSAEPPHTESDVQMKKSLRGNGPAQPNGTIRKKQRPVSLPSGGVQPNSQPVNQNLRFNQGTADTAASAPVSQRNSAIVTQAPLRRKLSGDSDTSFKRARPATEGISMRRSMRRGSEVSANGRQQSPLGSSRFSLRSASPGGPSPVTMRGTMRGSIRGSNEAAARAKSPIRIPGFGRTSSARPAPKQKSMLSHGSRFADSSDEEDRHPGFRSRFVDSSDDDEPIPMPTVARPISSRRTPIRSIPRPAGYQDGDSSDLPDSDDDRPATAKSVGKSQQNGVRPASRNNGTLQRSGSGRHTIKAANGQGTLTPAVRPTNARRGSILSIFRKKPDSNAKVRKYQGESPARKDTPLERSRSDLEAIKRQDSLGPPSTPKLQKKNPYATRQNSASWPLSNETDDIGIKVPIEENRPHTADITNGVVGGENKDVDADLRPDVGNRGFMATGLSDVDVMVQGGGSTRKKKKFQALRKMFGLDD